jgi:catechol 2,3-dioxygenase-like lactoylglutathione lyase family enzyme
MAELAGPDFITFHVRDLEASRHFYADVLGLEESPEKRPNAVAFTTRTIGFAIRQAEIDLEAVSQLGYGIVLWLRADDSAAFLQKLKGQGVTITQGLSEGPFGKTFTFRDPDGYLITVHDRG